MPLAYFKVIDGPNGRPDNSLPGGGGQVDNGLPPLPGAPDNTLPEGPPGIWPPLTGNHPVQPLPPNTPIKPGTIWPPVQKPDNSLPGVPAPTGKFWVVAGIPGVGWRYVCIDIALKPDNSLPVPGQGLRPDNSLPGQGGEVDNSLPGQPAYPDQGLPPSPDQGLPSSPGGSPDNSLPGQPGRPSTQPLPPGGGARPGQLPGQTPQPKR